MGIDEKKQKLLEKKQQLQRQLNAIMARENKQKRKEETRKKILAGSWILHEAGKSEEAHKKLLAGLDKFLIKEGDRKLFGLDRKEEN